MKHTTKLVSILLMVCFAAVAYARPPGGGFNHIDEDNDGLISPTEFANRDRGPIERMDQDGDGAVSQSEIDAHIEERVAEHQARMEEMMTKMRERMDEMFANADSNGDGLITQEEATLAMFSRIDENGDGYLSEEELRDARPDDRRGKHKKRRRGDWGS